MTCPSLQSVTYPFTLMILVLHSNMNMWKEIEEPLNLSFYSLCEWFTKSILFGTKLNIKRAEGLNIVYENDKIKQLFA